MRCSRIFGPSSRGPPVRAPGTAGAVTVAAFAVMASRWSRGAVDSPTTLSTLPPQAAFAAESLVTRYVPGRRGGPSDARRTTGRSPPHGPVRRRCRAVRLPGTGAPSGNVRERRHSARRSGLELPRLPRAQLGLRSPVPLLEGSRATGPRHRDHGPGTGEQPPRSSSPQWAAPVEGPRTSSGRRNIDSPAGTRPAPASRRPVPGYSAPSRPRCLRSAAPSAQASPRRCPAPPAASSPAPSPPREGASPRWSDQSERPQNALLT